MIRNLIWICLKDLKVYKEDARKKAVGEKVNSEEALYNLSDTKEQILEDAKKAGVMYDENLDARYSLSS